MPSKETNRIPDEIDALRARILDVERQAAEHSRAEGAARALTDVGRDLAGTLDADVVGQRIADSVRRLLGSLASAVFRPLSDSGDLVALAASGDWGPTSGRDLVVPEGTGLIGLAVRERVLLTTSDVLTDPRVVLSPEGRSRVEQAAYRAVLAVPLVVQEQVIGALAVGDRPGRVFETAEIALAQAFADQAALALQNARLYTEATRRRREAEALAQVARLLTESLEVEDLAERIVQSIVSLFGARSASIRRLEPDGSLATLAFAGASRDSFAPGHVFPPGIGTAGRAVAEGRPVWTADLLNDPEIVLTDDVRHRVAAAGNRAVLAAPLRARERIIGAITITLPTGRVFGEDEVRLAAAFADQAAIALENAGLFVETRERLRETETLAAVGRVLSQKLPVEEVMRQVAREVGRAFRADTVGAYFLDAGKDALVPMAGYHVPKHLLDAFLRTPFPPSRIPFLREALETRRPVWTSDYLNDPRFDREFFVEGRPGALLFAPTIVRGEMVGGLGLVWRAAGRAFSATELRLIEGVASQVGLAIENADLVRQMQQKLLEAERLYEERTAAYRELSATQDRLIHTEKLRALGEMAAGVAHDFNNLLAVILGRAELLLRQAHEPDLIRGLETVRQAALDGARTVRRIQEFTRTRRTRPFGRVDLREVVEEVVELHRPRWKDEAQSHGLTYEVSVEGGQVPAVAGRPEELREVFTNLLGNALEAMPAGGRLVFRVGTEGDAVVVTTTDTGCGMSEEIARRVFEPFFTTKGPRGSGLGLAVVWGIINRHGGTVEVESRLGEGSTFTVRLPISHDLLQEEKTDAPPRPARAARILVIDDERSVREVLRDMLVGDGHVVLEAADGTAGLGRCEAEPVDLVLSDVSMPGMSGWDVAAACRTRFPTIPVGLITGWGDQLDPDQLEAHRIRFVLAKPFQTGDVLRQIEHALSAAAS